MNQVLVFTGAGLSAESGLPTFRDPSGTGLWTSFDPQRWGTLAAYDEHPDELRAFYDERRRLLGAVRPTLAHQFLAGLQAKWGPQRVRLFTQNGDDLLGRAGAADVVHVHGELTKGQCRDCGHRWSLGYGPLPPACPLCGSARVKPDVVLFGEDAPLYEEMDRTFRRSRGDLVLVIGTLGLVIPFKRIVGNRHHPDRSCCVLNNLHREEGVAYRKYFDATLFCPATEAAPLLQRRAEDFLSGPATR